MRKLTAEQWKKIGIRSAVVLFLLFLVLIFYPVRDDFLKVGPPEMKMVEMEDVSVIGFKKGKRTFEIMARYVWSPRTTDRATLEDITDGSAYDNGRKVIADLQARRVYANSQIEQLVAQEGVKATVLRRKKGRDTEDESVSVWAENMTYSGQDKRSKVSGTLRLFRKDTQVYADSADIDHDKDTVTFREPFKVIQKNVFLTARTLTTYLNNDRFLLEGRAKIIRKRQRIDTENIEEREIMFKKEDLEIQADTIDSRMAHDKVFARLYGRVIVLQKGKKAFADSGTYDEQKDFVELRRGKPGTSVSVNAGELGSTGQAGLIMDRTEWLLDKETLKKLKDPKTRETFSKQTTMLGDMIRIKINAKDAFAQGTVRVSQKGKLAYGDRAYYLEKEQEIRLFGNVRFQQDDGTWLSAEQAAVSLKDNTFRALGEVESRIFLEKK